MLKYLIISIILSLNDLFADYNINCLNYHTKEIIFNNPFSTLNLILIILFVIFIYFFILNIKKLFYTKIKLTIFIIIFISIFNSYLFIRFNNYYSPLDVDNYNIQLQKDYKKHINIALTNNKCLTELYNKKIKAKKYIKLIFNKNQNQINYNTILIDKNINIELPYFKYLKKLKKLTPKENYFMFLIYNNENNDNITFINHKKADYYLNLAIKGGYNKAIEKKVDYYNFLINYFPILVNSDKNYYYKFKTLLTYTKNHKLKCKIINSCYQVENRKIINKLAKKINCIKVYNLHN
jgi:hypothetical protein